MIDAAHRWKAMATDGCHRHLTRNHKLVPLITSKPSQSRFNERGNKVLFRETEATKPVRQDRRESTSRLRDGLELVAIVGQQATEHMSRESLNAVEDRTAFEAEGNRHVMGGEKSLRCATD